MIVALMLDAEDSVDFPENDGIILGRPVSAYPLLAAKASGRVDRAYVVTQSQPVKSAATQYGAFLLDPPKTETPGSRSEALLRHGWSLIREEFKGEPPPELIAVLFAHSPAVTAAMINAGVEALLARPELDSAVSVSPHNRWNPFHARREGKDGLLEPYVPPVPDARGDAWFPDWGLQLVRPRVLDAAGPGLPPFPWLGKMVFPLKQWGGGPVDYKWQIPKMEYWLKKHGVAEGASAPEPQPKPQPAPKPDRR